MSHGLWGRRTGERLGASPSYTDAYNLVSRSLVLPGVISETADNVSLSTHLDIYKVTHSEDSAQYFLLQQRKFGTSDNYDRGMFDSASNSATGGLLIGHVDESVPGDRSHINDKNTHMRFGIEEAHGGIQHLQRAGSGTYGNLGDLWGVSSFEFSEISDPSSGFYSKFTSDWRPPRHNIASGITISGIAWNSASQSTALNVLMPPLTDEQKVAQAKAAITWDAIRGVNVEQNNVFYSLRDLPSTGMYGVSIEWSSSNTSAMSNSGGVVYGPIDRTTLLTAALSLNGPSDMVSFTLTVKASPATYEEQEEQVAEIKSLITWDLIRGENTAQNNVITDLAPLPTRFRGASIRWTSSDASVDVTISDGTGDGRVTRPSYASGDKAVTLTATITSSPSGVSDTVVFDLIVKRMPNNDADRLAEAKSLITWDVIRGANKTQGNVITNLALPPTSGAYGTSIKWSSNDPLTVSNTGIVTCPPYGAGSRMVALTATLSLGGISDTVVFTLIVKEEPPSGGVTVTGVVTSVKPKNPVTFILMQGSKDMYQTTILPTAGIGQITQRFAIEGVLEGVYDLVVHKSGHLTYTITNIVVGNEDIDLTANVSKAYSRIVLLAGDVEVDNSINAIDLATLLSVFNLRTDSRTDRIDIDGDGVVTALDLAYLLANFNKTSADTTVAY